MSTGMYTHIYTQYGEGNMASKLDGKVSGRVLGTESGPDSMVKKDTGAKERAVNAIIGHKLVCTACCRLVNYYNCEVPAIFRLALVHQRYMPTYRPADTVRHHGPFSNSRARETRLRPYIYIYFFQTPMIPRIPLFYNEGRRKKYLRTVSFFENFYS